jgi:predicted HNH restriction endonuclease
MDLYIKILNGKPVDHPLLGSNLVYLKVDLSNLPEDYAVFHRVEKNVTPNRFEIVYSTYEWNTDKTAIQDVWHVRDMTDSEKDEKLGMMLGIAKDHIEQLKSTAAFEIEHAVNSEDAEVWQNYLESLNEFSPTKTNLAVPIPPRKDESGKWISVNSPGSTPNVIG